MLYSISEVVMFRSVLAAIVLVCAFSSILLAQTETVIDTRGKELSQPQCCNFVDFSGFGSHPNEALKAVFTVDDLSEVTATVPTDYEMVITNRGKDSVVIPRSLDWKDVDTGTSEQRFERAVVLFQLSAEGGSDTWLSKGGVTLYSSDDRPSSQLVLGPGDSIRILGSTVLADPKMVGLKLGKATLSAQFCLTSVVWLRPDPAKDAPKKNGAEPGWQGRSLRCASVEQKYEVSLGREQ